jgi:hypothetical protein
LFDHEASGEGKGLLVDRLGVWKETEAEEHGGSRRAVDHWLAGSVPGWTPVEQATAFYQSRYLSNEGRVFFDSPDQLVGADRNGKEDVYEFEPDGVGSCSASSGCVALLSSGLSAQEAAFMDASENGNDAFVLTSQPLTSADHDQAFDVYDAHVCSESTPCITLPVGASTPCETVDTCRPASPAARVLAGPSGTAAFSGASGPTAPGSRTLPPQRTVKPKALTRAQRLANALKACRAEHKRSKRQRQACERDARKKYKTHSSSKKAKHARKASR